MPRKPKVSTEDFIAALVEHENAAEVLRESLPAYSSEFYVEISLAFHKKYTAQDIYRDLRENRYNRRTLILKKLGLLEYENRVITEDPDASVVELQELNDSLFDTEDMEFMINESFSENEQIFLLIIKNDLYELIKPEIKEYKTCRKFVMKPRRWADIINDEFWRQFRLPCAYSFKKAQPSQDPDGIFLKIFGHCKSKKCNSHFYGIVKREPEKGEDLRIEVKALDTSLGPHEEVKRQLKFQKRQNLGQQVLIEGAANLEKRIAREEMRLGDVNPPILYDKTVLRKLRQEIRDKDLGLSSEDGTNPILTLQKLKYTPPYVGSIHTIGLDDFTLHVFMSEFIHAGKSLFAIRKKMQSSLSTAAVV